MSPEEDTHMITNYKTDTYPLRDGSGVVVTIETRQGVLVAEGIGADTTAAMADLAQQVVLYSCAGCGRELCRPIDRPEEKCAACIIAGFKPVVLKAKVTPTEPARPTPAMVRAPMQTTPPAPKPRPMQAKQGALTPGQITLLLDLRKSL